MERTGLKPVASARCFPFLPGKHLKITRKTRNKNTYSIGSRARRWQRNPTPRKAERRKAPQLAGRYEVHWPWASESPQDTSQRQAPPHMEPTSWVPRAGLSLQGKQPVPGAEALPCEKLQLCPRLREKGLTSSSWNILHTSADRCAHSTQAAANANKHKRRQPLAHLGGMDQFAISTKTTKKLNKTREAIVLRLLGNRKRRAGNPESLQLITYRAHAAEDTQEGPELGRGASWEAWVLLEFAGLVLERSPATCRGSPGHSVDLLASTGATE